MSVQVMLSRIKTRHQNNEVDHCIVCGVEIKEGDKYFSRRVGGGGSPGSKSALYCIPHAKEKNHL